MTPQSQARARNPHPIAYETEHCIVRELQPADASDAMSDWLADPDTARALNAPARAIGLEDLRRYIAQHDCISSHLLGVFSKSTAELVGLWSIYIDWQHDEFLVNVLMPGRIEGDLGAMKETGRPLRKIMFMDLGLATMRYNILANNHNMHDRMKVVSAGMSGKQPVPEHTSRVAAASGQGTETVYHYRMTREEWLNYVETRPARDILWREARQARKASGSGDA